jgi:ATF/CREB family transcription factor
LSAQVTQLREEVVNLKTLLLAHKDCPVSQAQGLGGIAMSTFIGEVSHHANPYGMAMQTNGLGIPMAGAAGQMQRT